MQILSYLLDVYNMTIDVLEPYYHWYYQKIFVHYKVDLIITEEEINVKTEFNSIKKFVISSTQSDYLSKLDAIRTEFPKIRKRHIFLIDHLDKVHDISEKMVFYLDPLGHFWDKKIDDFPNEYYNLLFGIKPKIVEFMDDSNQLIQKRIAYILN